MLMGEVIPGILNLVDEEAKRGNETWRISEMKEERKGVDRFTQREKAIKPSVEFSLQGVSFFQSSK